SPEWTPNPRRIDGSRVRPVDVADLIAGTLRMTKLLKTGAAAILMMAVTLAAASATEQKKQPEPVQTVAVATPSLAISHRSNQLSDAKPDGTQDSNGWGMLAAGLSVGLLIIARRRRS